MLHLSIFWIVILILYLFYDTRKPRNFPRGPIWLPVIGSALTVKKFRDITGMFCKAVPAIAAHYRDNRGLLGLKIGKDRIVLTLTSDSLREFMLNEDLDGRPMGPFYETRTWNLRRGVLLTDGEFWTEQRRFVVKHLKEFGFARRGMVEIIQNEAEYLYEDFYNMVESTREKAALVKMQGIFSTPVLNTLWVMMAGNRNTRENRKLKELQQLLHKMFTTIDMVGCLFSHFPFLRFVAPYASGYRPFVQTHEALFDFLREEVENHKRTFHPENEPRDLMDVYIKSILAEGPTSNFTEQQLLAVCLDLFVAGSETTNKSISFAFLYLVRKQELQHRIQKELDAVIGRERKPLLEDRPNLPLCEAVVLEALRIFMANTLGIAHRALRSTKLCGFDIPKDTMVVGLYRGMMMDPKLWKNPEDFDPDRFLCDGKVKIPEYFYPFGLGKHRCMGELLARSNLFLFITTLLQSFCFEVPEGHPLPDDTPIDGATPSIRNYSVIITHRPRN
ncbi:probable cytochrome P450 303a1 [Culicoides brevitarsis]|uniref:probable cytochrome P450 303a1 n=1 Tax=Culicoides brevitarsis TaxID=469753 RepID=UPI00307CB853